MYGAARQAAKVSLNQETLEPMSSRPKRRPARRAARSRRSVSLVPVPFRRQRSRARGRKPPLPLRYRFTLLLGSLLMVLVGALIWTGSVYLARSVLPARDANSAAAERLLLGDGVATARRLGAERLAADLPPIGPVPEAMQRAIRHAAREVGVDTGYLVAVAARESSFDPTARAPRSSAAGLYQFTEDTWLRVVKVFGARHALSDYADQIVIDDEGGVSMPGGAQRQKLMQLRDDPRLAAVMAAELALDNKMRLERVLGRPVSPAEIYIAHFLGVTQAARIIAAAAARPHLPGARLLPAAAETNPGVFAPTGEALSAHAIIARIEAYFEREVPRFGKV